MVHACAAMNGTNINDREGKHGMTDEGVIGHRQYMRVRTETLAACHTAAKAASLSLRCATVLFTGMWVNPLGLTNR
jgi:hypothetical protein